MINVLSLDKGHLDVNLCELELPVGALVFVSEAAGKLIISLDATDHQDLLKLLRGLWQGVERSGFTPIRHEELARAFGSAFEKDWRFDFQKTLFIHVNPRGRGRLAAQAEVAGHLRTAQVQVTILQPQLLVYL